MIKFRRASGMCDTSDGNTLKAFSPVGTGNETLTGNGKCRTISEYDKVMTHQVVLFDWHAAQE
jgi:hypothetical protein